MIAGELNNKVDRVWDQFWSGCISNPLDVIEQLTTLLFIRQLATSTQCEPTPHRQKARRDGLLLHVGWQNDSARGV